MFGRQLADLRRGLSRLARQCRGESPFDGDIRPARIPLFGLGLGRPALPFPHPWNFAEPIRILETYFWGADGEPVPQRHNRYLEVPGLSPILVTRDPRVIRAIAADTGEREGQFDRDTLPSVGIARATGKNTLLYANGPSWRWQKKLAAAPFGKTKLFQPEAFRDFAATFRQTVLRRLDVLRAHLAQYGPTAHVPLEPEIKAVMLEMLTNNFFGSSIAYDEIRERYVPALEQVIDHIVRDTVINRVGVPLGLLPRFLPGVGRIQESHAAFDRLTDLVLAPRKEGAGLWKQFQSDVPDEALRSNLKVFLAGALEATTSFASWALAHLARHPKAQERVHAEVKDLEDYTPENLDTARYLGHVLEETLRLTPSLYFLPRRATADTWITTTDGSRLRVPERTHILLDVWHANRHEDHWGVAVTGRPALEFAPERWEESAALGRGSKELLHFGFGHGPRVCPGKHLGQLEVALVVGAFVKLFRFRAVHEENPPRAGVSTKPADGTLVELELREPYQAAPADRVPHAGRGAAVGG
jgi:cytochrome P450